MYYQNVRSVVKDLDNLCLFLNDNFYNCFVLTETWLSDTFCSAELCSNYKIFRRDRGSRGGGIVIGVHPDFKCELFFSSDSLEILSVSVTCNKQALIIIAIYIPPPVTREIIESLEAELECILHSIPSDYKVITLGDFNLPEYCLNYGNIGDSLTRLLINLFYSYSLSQNITFPTRGDKFLDLIFSNFNLKAMEDLAIFRSDHRAVVISCEVEVVWNVSHSGQSYLDYNRTNFEELNRYLGNVDWDNLIEENDVDLSFNRFVRIFTKGILDFTPMVSVPFSKKRSQPWFTKELRLINNIKNQLHNIYLDSRSLFDYVLFKTTRAYFKRLNNKSKYLFFRDLQFQLRNGNSSPFWKYIKKFKLNDKTSSIMKFNGINAQGGEEIANLFQCFFCEQFNDKKFSCPEVEDFSNESIALPVFDSLDVSNVILNLNSRSTLTTDGIPLIVLLNSIEFISEPLARLINISISCCTFPNCLKDSWVIPKHKSGSTSEVTNFRPVSIISNISKIFERLIVNFLGFKISHLITESQHGFIPKKSTITNLAVFNHFISTAISNRNQVDVIYTDFSKAFESVNHELLIYKLSLFGLSKGFIALIKSFLSNRFQRVYIDGYLSKPSLITSGVIQGSIIGPLLFVMFINDLPTYVESRTLMFADDTKIYTSVSNFSDCIKFQISVNKLLEWCSNWGLKLNYSKCQTISFSKKTNTIYFDYFFDSYKITRSNSVKDLGIFYCSSFTFDSHVNHIVKNASKSLGFLKRICCSFSDPGAFIGLYFMLVRSKLEYGTVIWNTCSQNSVRSLESIQYRFLRFISFRLNFDYSELSYLQLCYYFGVVSLNLRRTEFDLTFFYKVLHSIINSSELLSFISIRVPIASLRDNKLFHITFNRTDYSKNSPILRGELLCNRYGLSTFLDYEDFRNLYFNILFVTEFGNI